MPSGGALDRDERVLNRFFNPAREKSHRVWGIFPAESHVPGDYLAVTNRRLLWITERNQNLLCALRIDREIGSPRECR